jgi:hypothetical protein
MGTLALTFSVVLFFAGSPNKSAHNFGGGGQTTGQRIPAGKQLFAVRGEVVKIAAQSKGLLAITIRPARDFGEVTVIARENDTVGSASGQQQGGDLFGLITGADDSRDNDRITAAELQAGDIVSVIYNPEADNKAVEIYIH